MSALAVAYWLYDTRSKGSEVSYTQSRPVRLLGGGLIKSAWIAKGSPMDVGWTVTDAEMLATRGLEATTSAIIIDMTPSRATAALFQLKAVSGWTAKAWTPMMLHLRALFWDVAPDRPIDDFKKSFECDPATAWYVRSIMYVQPNWTRGGGIGASGTLITDDLWEYFVQEAAAFQRSD